VISENIQHTVQAIIQGFKAENFRFLYLKELSLFDAHGIIDVNAMRNSSLKIIKIIKVVVQVIHSG
jgi:hypothetical protein